MQSFCQYKKIRAAVSAQVESGRVDNTSAGYRSVLEHPEEHESDTSSFEKETWDSRTEGEEIIVGWQGPNVSIYSVTDMESVSTRIPVI